LIQSLKKERNVYTRHNKLTVRDREKEMATTVASRQLFIDGEWKAPILNKRIPIINPSTENIIGTYLNVSGFFYQVYDMIIFITTSKLWHYVNG